MRNKKCNEEVQFHTPTSALDALEQVLESSYQSKLTPEYLKAAELPLKYLCDKYNITAEQAVFLSIILEHEQEGAYLRDIGRHLNCSNISLLSKSGELDGLVERKFIWKGKCERPFTTDIKYAMLDYAIEAIRKNEMVEPRDFSCENWEELLVLIEDLYESLDDDNAIGRWPDVVSVEKCGVVQWS